ncbi:MAG: response regulator, partial [Pseudomonadota bacterium]
MPGRILIVEDTPTNRLILRSRLMQAYYDVIEAENGYQALDLVRSADPDLILLDVMMPGIDGFEVCRRLKSEPDTLHIPIVMLTALDKREDRVKGIEAGADDFLSKPFEDVALMSRVDSLTRMKMMVDELALRGQTSSGVSTEKMLENARALTFEESDILIVSECETMGRRLREHLGREIQCNVELARTGDEANALIEFIGFDAVLIDEKISDVDPLRLGTMIRARPETRQAATVLVVAENDLTLATR